MAFGRGGKGTFSDSSCLTAFLVISSDAAAEGDAAAVVLALPGGGVKGSVGLFLDCDSHGG